MDYNIYIHDKTSNQSKPTQPRVSGSANVVPKTAQGQKASGQVANYSQLFKVGKAGKAAAILYATYKISDSIISTIEPFVTRETGDYRFNVTYNNVKSALSAVLNPIGAVKGYLTYNQEIRLFNQKQEQQRLLIGEKITNSSNRKV